MGAMEAMEMNEALEALEAGTVTRSAPPSVPGAADRLSQLRSAARSLWLAGLGALGTVADLDRESRGLFDRLVERGRPVEELQMEVIDEMGDRSAAKLREIGELVRDQVRYDVDRALTRVGVPTREDWSHLALRLETLSRKIDELV
jgi:poly(hydroxyalkanoate) granule-associated protein